MIVSVIVWGKEKGVLWAYSVTVLMFRSQFGILVDPGIYSFNLLLKSGISVARLKMVNKAKHDVDGATRLSLEKPDESSLDVRDNPVLHLFLEDGIEDDKG